MPNTYTFSFSSLPKTVDELRSVPEASLSTPFMTAALTVAVLCNYENDPQETFNMLNFLKGPQPLSPFEQQFIRDRLRGKMYVARSYFAGTGPRNNYEPSLPYTVTVFDNPYSYQNEGYATLYIRSSGADTERQVKLRRKGNQWFLWENFLLPDIRLPAELDPWA